MNSRRAAQITQCKSYTFDLVSRLLKSGFEGYRKPYDKLQSTKSLNSYLNTFCQMIYFINSSQDNEVT